MTTLDSPTRPSTSAVVGFIIASILLSITIVACQFTGWFVEQLAIVSASLAPAVHAGKLFLAMHAVIAIITSGAFYAFTRSSLRPVYKAWVFASVFAIPAIILRFVDTNADQTGTFIQIGLAILTIVVALIVRRGEFKIDAGQAVTALAIVPFLVWPFLLWGALGSGSDALLTLIAGLAFGVLAALLIPPTTDNFVLDGLGNGVLLVLLGSAFGYDGGQLMLLMVLPVMGFAIAALSPSLAATSVAIGLLTAFPLMFFDPTEFTIALGGGEISSWATQAVILMLVLGLFVGAVLWAIGKWQSRPQSPIIPGGIAVVSWITAIVLYFTLGQPGFYGDRLFVILKDQADVSSAYSIQDRSERINFVYRTLTSHAENTQGDIRQLLNQLGVQYKPYYLVNAIEVRGGTLTKLLLASRPEVDRIIPSPVLRPLPAEISESPGLEAAPTNGAGWNIEMIGADKVWDEFGITGQGIVIGNSDTGVQGDHPALASSYRGLTEGDDYNWYDPWMGSASPNDQQGHGTHTTGTIVGSGGIGVAPGAQWIGCVNLERNLANPALYLECLQFMLAPFPHNGNPLTDGDPSKAADVLNNSWGCPEIEGCDANSLKPAADALRAAGIFVVVSTGNDGPGCSTVYAPLSLYDSVFSVGAVDESGYLADFSSRGPVLVDGSSRLKPDIVAPGVDVLSSLPGSTYGENSGTSMAGPHLVGVVALLWAAQPDLIGNIDRTEEILRDTATLYSGQPGMCGSAALPNNEVGYGIVNVYEAVKLALGE